MEPPAVNGSGPRQVLMKAILIGAKPEERVLDGQALFQVAFTLDTEDRRSGGDAQRGGDRRRGARGGKLLIDVVHSDQEPRLQQLEEGPVLERLCLQTGEEREGEMVFLVDDPPALRATHSPDPQDGSRPVDGKRERLGRYLGRLEHVTAD